MSITPHRRPIPGSGARFTTLNGTIRSPVHVRTAAGGCTFATAARPSAEGRAPVMTSATVRGSVTALWSLGRGHPCSRDGASSLRRRSSREPSCSPAERPHAPATTGPRTAAARRRRATTPGSRGFARTTSRGSPCVGTSKRTRESPAPRRWSASGPSSAPGTVGSTLSSAAPESGSGPSRPGHGATRPTGG